MVLGLHEQASLSPQANPGRAACCLARRRAALPNFCSIRCSSESLKLLERLGVQ